MIDKEITVPEIIECVNLTTKVRLRAILEEEKLNSEGRVIQEAKTEVDKPWSLYRGIVVLIASRPDWRGPYIKTHRLSAFLARLDGMEPGRTIQCNGELWCDLRATITGDDFEIQHPYNLQLTPLFAAILSARDVTSELKEVAQT